MTECNVKLEIAQLNCSLGEGPHWDEERQTLYFIDINSHLIYSYIPDTGELKKRKIDNPPGCIIPTDSDSEFLVATKKGIELVSFDDIRETRLLVDRMSIELKEKNRFNDGKVDPLGRLWVGTMAENCEGKEGILICLSRNNTWTLERSNVGISNGLAWSSDAKTMYYIDSPSKKVVAFDFNENSGQISNEREVFLLVEEGSVPDGMTIDSDGFLWIAIWGGNRVIRVDPTLGKEERRIILPSKNVTSCCFGGPSLSTLFVTTAAQDTDLSEYPQAGNVFSIDVSPIRGTPSRRFKLDL